MPSTSVLLTDGLNTQDRWYSNQAQIDAREKILCDNVKAAGITLWTIQVNTGGDPTSTLLQGCASSPDKFFLLTSAQQIISTFDNISFKITQLHFGALSARGRKRRLEARRRHQVRHALGQHHHSEVRNRARYHRECRGILRCTGSGRLELLQFLIDNLCTDLGSAPIGCCARCVAIRSNVRPHVPFSNRSFDPTIVLRNARQFVGRRSPSAFSPQNLPREAVRLR